MSVLHLWIRRLQFRGLPQHFQGFEVPLVGVEYHPQVNLKHAIGRIRAASSVDKGSMRKIQMETEWGFR